jgi:hypothetical protein
MRLAPNKQAGGDTFFVRRIARLRVGDVADHTQTIRIDEVHVARPSSCRGDQRVVGSRCGAVNIDRAVVKRLSDHRQVSRRHPARCKPERGTRILIEAREIHCVCDRVAGRVHDRKRV